MKEVTFEESRKIQLDILIYFDDWCKRHGLHYSLGEGTLIGAIRHKGFIPWDDDIDLLMPREDYDKFVNTYQGKYRLISLRTEKRWWSCYSRLTDERTFVEFSNPNENYHGLWISVFPIDNYPDNQHDWTVAGKKIQRYITLAKVKDSYWVSGVPFFRNLIKYPIKAVLKLITYNSIGLSCQNIMKGFENPIKKKKMTCAWHEPWVIDACCVESFVEVDFEGYRFPAIQGYDEYLRVQYGDYMKLPPEEQRIAKHGYKVYWK